MLRQTEKLIRQVTAFTAVTAVLGHHTPHIPELCISSKRTILRISNIHMLLNFILLSSLC